MAVAVSTLQRAVPIPAVRLRRLAELTLRALGRPEALVHLTFVNDARITQLNKRHRGVRARTDVLAFPLEGPGPSRLLGEVIISVEGARRQARRLGVPLALELSLLVVHGLLHLVGYDDRDPLEARVMHERERVLLASASRPVPKRLWTGLLSA
ncbi:MAG: rRNA maturation RNase YbeY [Candidatus Methylomirabilia bacterium]